MTIPAHVVADVSAALQLRRSGSRIVRATPVGGGCINHGTRIETERGARLFLKWNTSAPAGMFEAEVDGLRALRSVEGVRAPEPLAHGADWLLLEHIETGGESSSTSEQLGRMLAALHSADRSTTFGWQCDNWIGSLPQANTPSESWGAFWRDHRIAPQLERARKLGYLKQGPLDRVLDVIPSALADVEQPELVHGDLWGGTTQGAWRLRKGTWSYFWGKRWLPDNRVTSIAVTESGVAFLATPQGVSRIEERKMSLADKAAHYEAIIAARHNRRGWVTGCALKVPGDERSDLCHKGFAVVPGLLDLVNDVGLAARADHALFLYETRLQVEAVILKADRPVARLGPPETVEEKLNPAAPSAWMLEPPGFRVHAWDGQRLVTHLAASGDFEGPYPFRDAAGRVPRSSGDP